MIVLTYEDALRYAREGIQERGEDYVYEQFEELPRCRYVADGRPSCFVGLILEKAGITLTEEMNAWGTVHSLLATLLDTLHCDGRTKILLSGIQAQDAGLSWGESLRMSINSVESFFFEEVSEY